MPMQSQLTHVRRTWTEVTGMADLRRVHWPLWSSGHSMLTYEWWDGVRFQVRNSISMKQNFSFGKKKRQ